jgi:drug/metabolite transporter (DMT)-like permease
MFLQGFVYAWSQYYLPLPIVVTLYASTPVFSAFFDWLVFGIGLNKKQKIWLALAFSGVLLTANGKYLEKVMGSMLNSSSQT